MNFSKEHLKKVVVMKVRLSVPVLCSLNATSNNDKRLLLSGKQLILLLLWVEEL